MEKPLTRFPRWRSDKWTNFTDCSSLQERLEHGDRFVTVSLGGGECDILGVASADGLENYININILQCMKTAIMKI